MLPTEHSHSMQFCTLWYQNVRRSECGLFKKCLASITHKYAMAVETIQVKQCSIMYKTLTYSNFEAFDFNFDMVLYYMYFYVT